MKREASDHPKLWDLIDLLPDPYANRGCAMGFLEAMWHFTAKYTPQGDIGAKSDTAIVRWIGWPLSPETLIGPLVDSGWLDADADARVLVHDWSEHTDDAVHRQLARARLRFADGTAPKLTRLSEKERQKAEAFYGDGTPKESTPDSGSAHAVRPECAPPEPEPRQSQSPARAYKEKEQHVAAPAAPGDASSASPSAERCRKHLVAGLLILSPKGRIRRKRDFAGWDRDMDRLLRIDQRSEAEVVSMIDWALGSEFWAPNIQSPAKLRKQWDRLVLEQERGSGKNAAAEEKRLFAEGKKRADREVERTRQMLEDAKREALEET